MKNKSIVLSAAVIALSMSLGGCKLADLANADIDPAMPVAPELVAKHSADYTGTTAGNLTIDDKTKASIVDTVLNANFDEGTVGGQFEISAPNDQNQMEATAKGTLVQTAIEGRNFSGISAVDGSTGGNVTVTQQTGTYAGAFSTDGSSVAGTAGGSGAYRRIDGITGAVSNGTFDYDFAINGTEVTP